VSVAVTTADERHLFWVAVAASSASAGVLFLMQAVLQRCWLAQVGTASASSSHRLAPL
jgi:hypothetical protein